MQIWQSDYQSLWRLYKDTPGIYKVSVSGICPSLPENIRGIIRPIAFGPNSDRFLMKIYNNLRSIRKTARASRLCTETVEHRY